MLQDDNGTFYWFGESEKVFSLGVDFLSAGVNLYTSQDLATWQFAGLIFNSSAQISGMPYEGPYRVERPKVLLSVTLAGV
jgi:sucrose-6-phosphate hydrolase SacC (GH32 family)